LPAFLFNGTNSLRQLNISGNYIKSIEPYAFCGLEKSLIHLNLSTNRLEFVKSFYFGNLDSLLFLDLSRNSLSVLELGAFDYLSNLVELLLIDNCLFQIHENLFVRLESLRVLNLNENLIKNMNLKSFQSLNRLRNLSLSGNLIEKFVIGDYQVLKNLSFLDLSANLLLNAFEIRKMFVLLNLNGNKMVNFKLIGTPENLRYLYANGLNQNTLQNMSFNHLVNLIELDLSFNNLTSLASFFQHTNSNLRKLWLQSSILNMDLNFLNNFKNLNELDLSSASFINWQTSKLLFNQLTNLKVLKMRDLNLNYSFIDKQVNVSRFRSLF
jgi:Leucine-rich repeat (LRR) protein